MQPTHAFHGFFMFIILFFVWSVYFIFEIWCTAMWLMRRSSFFLCFVFGVFGCSTIFIISVSCNSTRLIRKFLFVLWLSFCFLLDVYMIRIPIDKYAQHLIALFQQTKRNISLRLRAARVDGNCRLSRQRLLLQSHLSRNHARGCYCIISLLQVIVP